MTCRRCPQTWSVSPPSTLLPRPGGGRPTSALSAPPPCPPGVPAEAAAKKGRAGAREGVSRLFLKAQALLFGGYRDALVCSPVSSGDAEGDALWVPEGFRIIVTPSFMAYLPCASIRSSVKRDPHGTHPKEWYESVNKPMQNAWTVPGTCEHSKNARFYYSYHLIECSQQYYERDTLTIPSYI